MSEVQFSGLKGNYSFYQKDDSAAVTDEAKTQETGVSSEAKGADPDKVMDALAYIGAQNLVNISGKMPVNPADYLSEESIASIEESMTQFEEGVEKYADVIKAEFGGMFSEDQVYALAAGAFALE
ncbi:MAG: hypothetical protein LUE64_02230 [Candidatus Gastranaerophilales bacterium]|nr:hypothetical protein [Candidatus Gastranaerophilales bacterium]